MRTTLNLDDHLMRDVKREAAESGRTMTQVIEEALREALSRASRPGRPFKLRWITVEGRLRPGVDLTDRDALYETMEGGIVIAVDTSVLVYAHRRETEVHRPALQWITRLAEGNEPWGLPVFCLGEFIRVVTHHRLFDPPTGLNEAVTAIERLLGSPTLRLLSPGPRYPQLFFDCLRQADSRGNLVLDAQIAALCLEHGALHLLTLDRDFSRFPRLEVLSVRDPPA